ncbi:DUF4331 family protein [Pelagibius sp. Alg239-R121]|uniref:DUF4331 family protein n=1 Tax=Pelagibius sp. Alg239-R121 TaxID=2993448 RepID=UPI0024A64488|nr:DUF4331 family protein [Pelagibius sp. Alg239-R121]
MMKTTIRTYSPTLSAACVALTSFASTGYGAGHFTSGLQSQYPEYDLNDTYVFESNKEGHTSIISSSNPSAPGTGKAPAVVFGQGGQYNLHIAQDDKFETGMTLVFTFEGENVEVHKVDTPNAAVGEQGEQLGGGKIGETVNLADGIQVWTGRGDDPFFGNGVGLAKFNAAKQQGKFTPDVFKEDGDLFDGATASFIVVDVPNQMLGEKVSVFTTTSVEHKGEWSQVDRHANVLFPYVFLSDTPAVQEDHGQHRPDLDVEERRQAIVNNIFWAVSTSKTKPDSAMEYANEVADMIMPDVLTYTPGTRASYAVEGLNGRALHDDAMNTVLRLMNGVSIDDNAYDVKRYTAEFPYIVSAE